MRATWWTRGAYVRSARGAFPARRRVSQIRVAGRAGRILGDRAAILISAPLPVLELEAAVLMALPHERRSLSQRMVWLHSARAHKIVVFETK